jgi:phosphoribosylanthranilate isomerase
VDEILRDFQPDILQTDIDDIETLDLPKTLSVLAVVRPGPQRACLLPGRFLYEGPVSGSGQTADWDTAAELARRGQLILAGGLNSVNVGVAVHRVRPFGVDVSSGVEAQPGVKSAEKIEQFVAAARMAALELNT